MRLAKRATAGNAAFVEQPCEGMDHRGLKRLGRGERRQDARQPRRQHGFAGTGGSDHQHVVPPGGGDFQRALGPFLPLHVAKIAALLRFGDLARAGRRQDALAGEMLRRDTHNASVNRPADTPAAV